MSDYAIQMVVDLAISQIGYKETGTNINKYAAYIDKNYPNFYNGKKQGAEWCDVFVDYLFLYNFGETNAMKMLYQPKKSCGAGCKFSAEYYKAKKAFKSTPAVGDQIFFYVKGSIGHTGIVVAVSGDTITTVEGNKSNSVKECTYKKGDSNIAGYGRPKWSVIPDPDAEKPVIDPEPQKETPKEQPKETSSAKEKPSKKTVKASHKCESFNKSLSGTYIVTASALNMRDGAGTKHKVLTVLPRKQKVVCYGYYSTENKTKWLYVATTYQGIDYEGFCAYPYLSK